MGKSIPNKDKYGNAYDDRILELYRDGVSNRGIAKLIGIPRGPITTRMKHMGLVTNRSGRKKSIEVSPGIFECTKCFVAQPIDSFFLQKSAQRPYRLSYCKSCKRRQSYDWRYLSRDRYLRDISLRAARRGRLRGLNVDITPEYMSELADRQGHKCFYTDAPLKHSPSERRNFGDNYSIDKIVPSLGYVRGNVVWCQQRINTIKSDVSLDEMKEWMPEWYRRIVENKNVYTY